MADRSRCFDRRAFLLALPALVVGAGAFQGCGRESTRHSALDLLVADLEPWNGTGGIAEQALAGLQVGARIGSGDPELIRTGSGDQLRERLARDLLPGSTWRGGLEIVRRALDRRVREDYDEARTVEINGWILSRTEVQLLAYRALADAES